MPVMIATVQQGDMPVKLNALGTVTPLAMVTVRTQINGQLTQVGFEEGQEINKGDFLAEIDPRPYQAALDQTQGQLMRDQAQLANARRDLGRYAKLFAENSIAQQQRDTQEALVRQLEGTVATDQGLVDQAKLNLTYCHIVAPVSGRVGLRQVDPGNYVQVSDANGVLVITQMKPISVIFTLPEDSLPAIIKRLNARATLPATAFDRGGITKLAEGTLITVDNQIDPATGTVKLRAKFANDDEALFPNQFVNIQLLADTLSGAMLAPAAAIQRGAPGTFVYVVKSDHTVAVQPVKLGPGDGQNVAVVTGLAAGDKVVIDGADKLHDGARVTMPADDATAQRQPGATLSNGGGGDSLKSSDARVRSDGEVLPRTAEHGQGSEASDADSALPVKQAEQQLATRQLEQPPGNNALETYHRIAALSPKDAATTYISERLSTALWPLALDAKAAGRWDDAARYVDILNVPANANSARAEGVAGDGQADEAPRPQSAETRSAAQLDQRAAVPVPSVTSKKTRILDGLQAITTPPSTRDASRATGSFALKWGDAAMQSGDVVAARQYYQVSASAGVPGAAKAVARTYDPVYLQQMGARSFQADPLAAKRWYEKAIAEGDTEARTNLKKLLNTLEQVHR